MAEYIDREAFEVKLFQKKMATSDHWINDVKAYRGAKEYRKIETDVDNFLRGYNEAVADASAILDSIIAADVVEVVRCKDCKHREDRLYCRLHKHPVIVTNTDFCSYGERKEQ